MIGRQKLDLQAAAARTARPSGGLLEEKAAVERGRAALDDPG